MRWLALAHPRLGGRSPADDVPRPYRLVTAGVCGAEYVRQALLDGAPTQSNPSPFEARRASWRLQPAG